MSGSVVLEDARFAIRVPSAIPSRSPTLHNQGNPHSG
jgi:hypothetical protein